MSAAEPANKPEAEKVEATEHPKPFMAWLREQRNGGLHGELSEYLAELVQAVIEFEKQGSLSLTIKVEPADGGAVFIADEIKLKAPEADKPKSLFFADSHGNVSRRDPRQAELPLRQVGQDDNDETADKARKAV